MSYSLGLHYMRKMAFGAGMAFQLLSVRENNIFKSHSFLCCFILFCLELRLLIALLDK